MNQLKMVSVKTIVSKILNDLAINEQVDEGKILLWVLESYQKCFTTETLLPSIFEAEIKNYKVLLPCDFMVETIVNFNCSNMEASLGVSRQVANPRSYLIKYPYIQFPRKEGILRMEYLALPLDEEGLPLIPDDDKGLYAEQALHYFIYKVKLADYYAGKISYNELVAVKNMWGRMADKAAAHSVMPNGQQIYAHLKSMNRLAPNLDWRASSNIGGNLNKVTKLSE